MARMRDTKTNVLAGSFLTIGVVLFIATVITLSDLGSRLQASNRYVVRFGLAQGVSGLAEGSQVQVGGRAVGRVTKIGFTTDESGEQAIDVEVTVRADLTLFEDARAEIVTPLIGSVGALNIPAVGDGSQLVGPAQGGDPRLADGEMLVGALAPPSFLAQAGIDAGDVRDILDRVKRSSERLDNVLAQAEERFPGLLDEVDTGVGNVNAIVADAREAWPAWRDRIDTTLENAESFSTRADDGVQEIREAANALLASAQDTLDRNRPKVDEFMDNASALSDKLNTELYAEAEAALQAGRGALEDLEQVALKLDATVDRESPVFARMLANARLAADQLKLTMQDVRASPWRVLYQPGLKEIESELLYGAMRAYVEAADDVRAASVSLENLVGETTDDAGPARIEMIEALGARLGDALGRFEQAEETLFEQFVTPGD